jgi:sugar phosphate permease
MALSVASQPPNCQPLVTDYVKKSSRGQATAFQALGFVVGDLITMGVLLNVTKNLDPTVSFIVAAIFVGSFSFIYIVIVKEPNLKKH